MNDSHQNMSPVWNPQENLAKAFRAQTLGFLGVEVTTEKFEADWTELKKPYLDSVPDFLALLHHFAMTIAIRNADGTLTDILPGMMDESDTEGNPF